ncbi:MAG: hypothetical protein GXO11_04365 [Epsilonproteobacteria bacterium]|nr:hypothetical protein [Campylobacterota bacterium]
MKKIFLTLLVFIIGLISAFFLNSDFRNLIINISTSTSKEEVFYQLGKNAPPLIHITHSVTPSFKKDNEKIYNYYVLIITNINKKDSIYELKINNNKFSHSIKTNLHVASHQTKKIPFQISIPVKLNKNSKNLESIELIVIDKNNPTLTSKEYVGFILKNIYQ